MRHHSKRRSAPPEAEANALHELGERIAADLSLPVTSVRYANYRFHNGQSWTIRYCWEQFAQNGWTEIDPSIVRQSGNY